eukprot:99950-Chlamydomonas_euryale.AAC.3
MLARAQASCEPRNVADMLDVMCSELEAVSRCAHRGKGCTQGFFKGATAHRGASGGRLHTGMLQGEDCTQGCFRGETAHRGTSGVRLHTGVLRGETAYRGASGGRLHTGPPAV